MVQKFHSYAITEGGDPFHAPGIAAEELRFSFATSPSRYQQHMMPRRLAQAFDYAHAAPSQSTSFVLQQLQFRTRCQLWCVWISHQKLPHT